MVVEVKVCDLTEDLLWFVCGLYVGIFTSSLKGYIFYIARAQTYQIHLRYLDQ